MSDLHVYLASGRQCRQSVKQAVIASAVQNVYTYAMTFSTPTLSLKNLRPARKLILFSVASVFLHLLALQSLSGRSQNAAVDAATEKTVQISLRAASAATSAPAPLDHTMAPATTLQPATRKKVSTIRAAATEIGQHSTIAENPSEPVIEPTIEPMTDTNTAQADGSDRPDSTVAAAAPVMTPEPATDLPKYATRPPESAHMNMQVVRVQPDRNPMYGVASIAWENHDGRYRMKIEAGLDLLLTTIKLYQLSSQGLAGANGILPTISTEARRNRAETATHFNHDEKTIRFSASSASLPMHDGAQDKASFLMQLAAIGNADPSQFVAGREILIQVAEEKDAALFQFKIVAEEEIDTKLGKLMTWHLLRAPRPGSYKSQLEIWLAPSAAWFPVQIRNTESNGTVTTQTVTKFRQKND